MVSPLGVKPPVDNATLSTRGGTALGRPLARPQLTGFRTGPRIQRQRVVGDGLLHVRVVIDEAGTISVTRYGTE